MLDKRDPIADNVGAGYQAWCDGKPLSDDAGADFAEGWNVAADADWWKRLADRVGFVVTGFSGRYAASVLWPDQSTSEISGGLLAALEASSEACSRQEERLRDTWRAMGDAPFMTWVLVTAQVHGEECVVEAMQYHRLDGWMTFGANGGVKLAPTAWMPMPPPHAKDAADV